MVRVRQAKAREAGGGARSVAGAGRDTAVVSWKVGALRVEAHGDEGSEGEE
jgi:hypothetical protein